LRFGEERETPELCALIDFLGDTKADIFVLQEVDFNARRTHRLNIAQEIAPEATSTNVPKFAPLLRACQFRLEHSRTEIGHREQDIDFPLHLSIQAQKRTAVILLSRLTNQFRHLPRLTS
jgi:hypothetical protein